MPLQVALQILREAGDRGLLHPRYDDSQIRHGGPENILIDSRALGIGERWQVFESTTCD